MFSRSRVSSLSLKAVSTVRLLLKPASELMLKRIALPKPKNSKRSKSGAFLELFEAEERPLLRLAISLVGRREVAEEIVQESFLKLHLKWDEIDHPRAWLYRSLRNRILNHLRDERMVICDPKELSVEAVEDVVTLELTKLEAIQIVRGLMDSLPEGDRELLRLKYFEGLRYREISERTGMSIGNVGYRLHFLVKGLAEKLHSLRMD